MIFSYASFPFFSTNPCKVHIIMFTLQIKKLRLTRDKQMMKFTQPASGNARMRFRLGNSKLITVRLLLDSWDSGWVWTTLGLPWKLASSAAAAEKSSHFQESRDSSPPRRGSRLCNGCERKDGEIIKEPRTQLLLTTGPREGIIWNQLRCSPQHPKIWKELVWGLNWQKD